MSYVIFIDKNGKICAKNNDEDIDFKGSDISVIQNAVDALVPGEKIYIKTGIYTANSELTILKDNIIIEGENYGRKIDNSDATILLAGNGFTGNIVRFGSSSGYVRQCCLRNIAAFGNNSNNDGIQIYGNGCSLENVLSAHNGRDGISFMHISGDSDNYINNIILRNNIRYGLQLGSYDSRINNILTYSNSRGININSGGNYINGVNAYNNTVFGIAIESEIRNIISNGHLDNPGAIANLMLRTATADISSFIMSDVYFLNNPAQHVWIPASGYNITGVIFNNIVFEDGADAFNYSRSGTETIDVLVNGSYVGKQNVNVWNYVKFRHTRGIIVENNTLSGKFAIDSNGVKTIVIPHGLTITPAAQDCCLTVVQDTAVDDWTYDTLKIVSTDAINVIVKINISIASVMIGATARLALRIGNL